MTRFTKLTTYLLWVPGRIGWVSSICFGNFTSLPLRIRFARLWNSGDLLHHVRHKNDLNR
jgi:hypothetical protein